MTRQPTSTHDKALAINLDGRRHGTFAEIGAGQEVARWFFRVGGAAGTIAKTVSAYDMKFSDATYGPALHYVSRERLLAMLDHEYPLLVERLDASRGADTTFFAFANTVAARSYSRHDRSHGWMGVRFQGQPRLPPSQIVLHARLRDGENARQQEALGVLGVNLVHAAIYRHDEPVDVLAGLLDELSSDRVEVDMVEFSGPVFERVDNRLMSLSLVEQGLTSAALFRTDGQVVDPADAFYKRPVLVERGHFRPLTRLHQAILESATTRFGADLPPGAARPLTLFELTLRDLNRRVGASHRDFLAQVDALAPLGEAVMISKFGEYYALAEYLSSYTDQPVGLAVGVPALERIFEERHYEQLKGGLLEGCARLFSKNVRVYAFPTHGAPGSTPQSCDEMTLPAHLKGLFDYLRTNHRIEPL